VVASHADGVAGGEKMQVLRSYVPDRAVGFARDLAGLKHRTDPGVECVERRLSCTDISVSRSRAAVSSSTAPIDPAA
jgi:hypothetical protein